MICIAYHVDLLEQILTNWSPSIGQMINDGLPKNVGNKKSEKKRTRKSGTNKRNVSTYVDGRPKPGIEDNNKFHLIHLRLTKATTCYGCKRKFRATARDSAPPVPYDMVLGLKMYRSYTPAGSIGIKISKTKESAYFHLKKSCVTTVCDDVISSDKFVINEVVSPLQIQHKMLIRKEFGVVIN